MSIEKLLNRLVQKRCHILLLVPMRRRQHHNAVFDAECVQVIEHDMVGLGQHVGVALHWRVFVENNLKRRVNKSDEEIVRINLQQMRRQRRRIVSPLEIRSLGHRLRERLQEGNVESEQQYNAPNLLCS